MTLKAGWRAEVTYGVSPLAAVDDYVYYFGDYKSKHEVPVPWHDIGLTPVFRLGNTTPVNLVEGAKDVEFSMRFCPLGADEFKYLLGTITGGNTFTDSTVLPSRTIYIETDFDDAIVITGCVTKSLDFYADKNLLTEVEVKFLGAEVTQHAKLVPSSGSSPRFNPSLAIASSWGWGDNNAVKLDGTTIIGNGEINRVHVHVENILKPRVNDKVIEVRKVGSAVQIDFDVEAKDNTNLIIQAVRTATTQDFYYKWLRTPYTWELWANNCKLRTMKCIQKVGDSEVPIYSCSGQAFYDSTNTSYEAPFKFKASDGVTYS
jgi:hypothetical protein